jgi:hypothetical protein
MLESRDQFSDGFPEYIDSSRFGLSQQGLQFCEDLFDRVEIRRVGWQEQQSGTRVADHVPDAVALVAVEVVHDDDVAWLQCGYKDLRDIGFEAQAIDGTVNDTGRCQTITPQRSKECQCFPMPMWQLGLEWQTAFAPASEPRHVGLDPCLVDEDQTRRINPALILLPPVSPPGDIRPVLLAWQNGFF